MRSSLSTWAPSGKQTLTRAVGAELVESRRRHDDSGITGLQWGAIVRHRCTSERSTALSAGRRTWAHFIGRRTRRIRRTGRPTAARPATPVRTADRSRPTLPAEQSCSPYVQGWRPATIVYGSGSFMSVSTGGFLSPTFMNRLCSRQLTFKIRVPQGLRRWRRSSDVRS